MPDHIVPVRIWNERSRATNYGLLRPDGKWANLLYQSGVERALKQQCRGVDWLDRAELNPGWLIIPLTRVE